jgi:hypothetical protein
MSVYDEDAEEIHAHEELRIQSGVSDQTDPRSPLSPLSMVSKGLRGLRGDTHTQAHVQVQVQAQDAQHTY